MAKVAKTRSWPVRANALLLVLQAAGLVGICVYNVYQTDWQQQQIELYTEGPLSLEINVETTEAAEHAVVIVSTLGPPAVLAVLAALGFVFLFRVGWMLAMMVQAITLLACLLLYSDWEPVSGWEPVFIYPVMLYCIVMALYLNSSDVRAAFHVRPRTRRATRDL